MATIKDVASHAGLSVSVVSKYLKNSDSVRESTRQRVEAAIAALNYTPSLAARALRSGKTNMILIVIPDVEDRKANALFTHLQTVASNRGFTLVLLTEETLTHLYEHSKTSALTAYPVDGMLLCYPANHSLIQRFAEELCDIPRVVVGWSIWENVSSYLWDVGEPAYLMTKHLLDLGHQRIGYIGTVPRNKFFRTRFNREANFRRALMEADAPLYESLIFLDDSHIVGDDYAYHVGLQGAEFLLNRENRPTAILTETEEAAVACINWAKHHDISIPGDLAIASCEEGPACRWTYAPITTAQPPVMETAQMALEKLFSIIDGTDSGEVCMVLPTELPTEIHVRHSTDPSKPMYCK